MADAAIRRPHLLEDQPWLPRPIRMVVLFDGLVSCRRTYTPGELRALASGLGSYRWVIGKAWGKNPVPVSYLIGYSKEPT
jgi:hypothetical protein